jgi:hypothetical protein
MSSPLPDNIDHVVSCLRKWTADWPPPKLPTHGFYKSASMLVTEFDVYGAFIEQRHRYTRRVRCGICGKLIEHGRPLIGIGSLHTNRTFHFHHDKADCR